MFKAVLFDLDGTLLPMDVDVFLEKYLALLSKHMEPYMEPKPFVEKLMDATFRMINDLSPDKNNKEVFIETFFQDTDLNPIEMLAYFDIFYEKEFPVLAKFFPPDPRIPQIIEYTAAKSQIVVATNPIFPRVAIEERLRWAGVSADVFNLITSYENMHYCKPQVEYYAEILDILKIPPEKCIMVGNDVEEDLIARKLGIKTFLVDTYLINRENIEYETDYQGNLADLLQFVKNL